jgi:putative ABC transport system permease protein
MSTLNRKVIRDLRRMRSQAIAIGAVVAAGVCVSVMGVCNEASLLASQRDAYQRYRFADLFVSLKRAPQSIKQRLLDIPGVAVVETRVVSPALLDLPGVAEPVALRLVSLPRTHAPALNDVAVVAGRTLDPNRSEILVSQPFARAHRLLPGDRLTAILNNRRRQLTVAGIAFSPEFIYAVQPGTLFPNNRTFGIAWMDERAIAAAFELEGAFNDAALQLASDANVEDVIRRVDAMLTPYGGLGAYARANQPSHWMLEGEMSELRTTGRILPTIFAGVAAFLLHVVISRLVAAQREQIGVLAAFGYRPIEIAAHYAKLVAAIAAAGVASGVPMGIWLAWQLAGVYLDFFSFPALSFTMPPLPIVSAAFTAVAIALGGSVLALRAVLRIAPAVALRPPAPQEFRPTVLERLGITRTAASWVRIVLRNLERRPVRAALAVTSVSLAVAIMVLSRSGDAIRFMIDVEFSLAARQSGSVTFVDPKPLASLSSVRRLPGVLQAEPFRAVPVRFEHEGVTRRTSLTGVMPDAALSRPLTGDLQPVLVPPDGLVLSDKLAELLRVDVGQRVRVETLEGRRLTRESLVVATLRDYIGTSAYMDLTALNDLLGEGEVMSGAHLVVDPAHEPALFAAIKNAPGVAGLTMMRSVRRSFEDTLQKAFMLTMGFLLFLATVIAFGVVFNTARTMLAEQAWELATLRVLGFTRGEVRRILLTQIALIVAAAVPAGSVLGYQMARAVSVAYDTEVYRIPVKLYPYSYVFAASVIVGATAASAAVVWRLIGRLDFLSVLKARE